MTAAGFLEGRRLQMARGVLLQCIMGGYPESRFYGSDDGDLALVPDLAQLHRLPWSQHPTGHLQAPSFEKPRSGHHLATGYAIEIGRDALNLINTIKY